MRITTRAVVLSSIGIGLLGAISACEPQAGSQAEMASESCEGRAIRLMSFINWMMTVSWQGSDDWQPVGIIPWMASEDNNVGVSNERDPTPIWILEEPLKEPPACNDDALVQTFREWWERPDSGGVRWVQAHEAVHPVGTQLDSLPSPFNQQKLSQWFLGKPPHQNRGFWQWIMAHAAVNSPSPDNDPPPPPDPFGEG